MKTGTIIPEGTVDPKDSSMELTMESGTEHADENEIDQSINLQTKK